MDPTYPRDPLVMNRGRPSCSTYLVCIVCFTWVACKCIQSSLGSRLEPLVLVEGKWQTALNQTKEREADSRRLPFNTAAWPPKGPFGSFGRLGVQEVETRFKTTFEHRICQSRVRTLLISNHSEPLPSEVLSVHLSAGSPLWFPP